MKVIVLASDLGIETMLRSAAEEGGFETEGAPSVQSMTSTLYRDREVIGVIHGTLNFVRMTIEGMRMAEVKSPLLGLLTDALFDAAIRIPAFVRILGAGADDVQPASIRADEFSARVAALGRRDRGRDEDLVGFPNHAWFSPSRGEVTFPGGAVLLSRREASVLELLTCRPGTIVTKEMVIDHLYDGRDEPASKIVDVFVCKIRRKLELVLGSVDIIETVWGRGFRFIPDGYVPVTRASRVAR